METSTSIVPRRKASGFWTRPGTLLILQQVQWGEMRKVAAMQLLNCDYATLKRQMARALARGDIQAERSARQKRYMRRAVLASEACPECGSRSCARAFSTAHACDEAPKDRPVLIGLTGVGVRIVEDLDDALASLAD